MNILDNIKTSLNDNKNISNDVRDNIFELVVLFNSKFPDVSLENLCNRLKTLKIEKISKFLNRDVSMYDFRKNILYFNTSELKEEYDARHVLMFELINIISSTNYQTGFNNDNKFEALNVGYTEILTNYLVGNKGEKPIYPNEAIMANLISVVVGTDNLFEAYFKNDSKHLLVALDKCGVKL